MGTGKSVLARALAPLIGADIVQMDAVRKEMLRIPATEHRYEDFGRGIYADDVSRKAYAKALEIALGKMEAAGAVIIDASYKSARERALAAEAGRSAGADVFVVECACPDGIVEKRLNSRFARGGDVSDGRWEIFQAQKAEFERIDEMPGGVHVVADTSLPPGKNAVTILGKMLGLRS
jgi:predicted kinase